MNMIECEFTAEALDNMAERGIMQNDIQEGINAAFSEKTYIYDENHCIFRHKNGAVTVYGDFTVDGAGGPLTEEPAKVTVTSAYAHRIVFTAEEAEA
jgi:hypothetical protein